jgi:hypothetical protein
MKNVLFLSFLIILFGQNYAQNKQDFKIIFNAKFGNSDLILNETYYKLNKNDSIQIEVLKFFVSGIEFMNNDKLVWKEKNSFYLVDFENQLTQTVLFNVPTDINFTKIKFNLGVDSITSTSGALAGDLDPTKGMYWAWQSGYINFKMEGNSPSCNTRKHKFQFHFGGYKQPYYNIQTITLPINNLTNNTFKINLNLALFFENISLTETNSIMIPCAEAMKLSKIVAELFYINE